MTKYNLWFFSSLIIALIVSLPILTVFFSFFQAEDGIRDVLGSRGLGDVYKRQEFLLSEEAQNHIVNNTFEYPMIKGVSPHPLVVNMGLDFKQDLKTKVVNYGKRQADALEAVSYTHLTLPTT